MDGETDAMKGNSAPADSLTATGPEIEESLDLQTTLLCWIAALLVAGAAWLMASILVPIVLALMLSAVLTPLAQRLERLGMGRVGSALACLLLATGIVVGTGSLIAYQAGGIIQHADQHIDRIGQLMARVSGTLGGDRLLSSMGTVHEADGEAGEVSQDRKAARGTEAAAADPPEYWRQTLRDGLRAAGGWLVRGIGGFVGVLGSGIICLSFVFYFLETRSEWIDRIVRMLRSLGLKPRREGIERVRRAITVYGGTVAMISVLGVIVTGTTAWLLGIPQPFLWGLIFGLLEFIPYFGPLIGGTMMTLVAATSGDGDFWHAAVMLGVILAWMTLEGYVITPMVYGRAVRFDPVTVLVAVLFFGWLWGPVGMVTALPMMVMIRELVGMTPETPALDVLMES
jgi:predicted PurR-regulated permease PerM